jgi:hypothetical protein
MADATHWGIVSASYADGFGTTDGQPPNSAQHGILPSFGSVIVPREGSSLGALSTGSAATTDSDQGPAGSGEVDGQFKGFKNGMQSSIDNEGNAGQNWAPPGYPVATAGCPTLADTTYDAVNVILQIKVPANAQGFGVDFDFWSGEWPEYVCTDYNDAFVAYLTSQGFTGNISKDSNNNPISVNAGFFDRCTPGTGLGCDPETGRPGPVTGTSVCGGGPSELAGTGFSDPMKDFCSGGAGDPGVSSTSGGATGWLTSTQTLAPGETITIQFIIWDTGDWQWDSSVLLDNWKWAPAPVMAGTTRPPP